MKTITTIWSRIVTSWKNFIEDIDEAAKNHPSLILNQDQPLEIAVSETLAKFIPQKPK